MIYAEVTAACGHTVDVEIPDDCHACSRLSECVVACDDHQIYIDNAKEYECGDCYRDNHPSLTAFERNHGGVI